MTTGTSTFTVSTLGPSISLTIIIGLEDGVNSKQPANKSANQSTNQLT